MWGDAAGVSLSVSRLGRLPRAGVRRAVLYGTRYKDERATRARASARGFLSDRGTGATGPTATGGAVVDVSKGWVGL